MPRRVVVLPIKAQNGAKRNCPGGQAVRQRAASWWYTQGSVPCAGAANRGHETLLGADLELSPRSHRTRDSRIATARRGEQVGPAGEVRVLKPAANHGRNNTTL